jgi:hypothetical protein
MIRGRRDRLCTADFLVLGIGTSWERGSGRDRMRTSFARTYHACRARVRPQALDTEEAFVSKPIEPEHVLLEFFTICSFHPDSEPAAQPIPLFVLGFREGGEPVFIWLVDKNRFDGSSLTGDAYWQHALGDLETYFMKKLSKCVAEEACVRGGIELLVSTYQKQLRFAPLTPVADHPFGLRKTKELAAV